LVFMTFEYQGKFSYAPIFLLIGLAVILLRSWSTHRSRVAENQ
jgi:putative tricarboxylic transport membrane protein